jgi:hypothetical protein
MTECGQVDLVACKTRMYLPLFVMSLSLLLYLWVPIIIIVIIHIDKSYLDVCRKTIRLNSITPYYLEMCYWYKTNPAIGFSVYCSVSRSIYSHPLYSQECKCSRRFVNFVLLYLIRTRKMLCIKISIPNLSNFLAWYYILLRSTSSIRIQWFVDLIETRRWWLPDGTLNKPILILYTSPCWMQLW